jgi:hypothetical protein
MEAILFSETSVNPGSTQCHIPEDYIHHSHNCENLKSYTLTLCSSLNIRDQVSHPYKT